MNFRSLGYAFGMAGALVAILPHSSEAQRGGRGGGRPGGGGGRPAGRPSVAPPSPTRRGAPGPAVGARPAAPPATVRPNVPGPGAAAGRANNPINNGPRPNANVARRPVDVRALQNNPANRNLMAARVPAAYGGRPGSWGRFSNAYHTPWVNGYWYGRSSPYAFGRGAAFGLAAWGLGSMIYNWGYSNYSNPYYASAYPVSGVNPGVATTAAPVYDYSQPINLDAPLPDQQTADASISNFDQAREAFLATNYPEALKLTDQALTKLPNDPAIHEFRGVTLFALGEYDKAAATLNAVLAVGPGWDWSTLSGLYNDIDTYTNQLRSLEAYRNAHPESAAAAFVLGYLYLTANQVDAAQTEFKEVARLNPADKVSAAILTSLDATPDTAAATEPPPTPTAPTTPAGATTTAPIPPEKLYGTWSASPNQGTTIKLSLDPGGKFTWSVKDGQGERSFSGTASQANELLTLATPDGSAMVGRVSLSGDNQFNFKALGSNNADPGLSFKKAN